MTHVKGFNRKISRREPQAEPIKQAVAEVKADMKDRDPMHPQISKFVRRIKRGMELNPNLEILIQNERSK